MEEALNKLRDEVSSLQREEQTKLEEEKEKALNRLQRMVRVFVLLLFVIFISY